MRHWMPNAFCERGPITPKITAMSGSDTSATSASCHEIENIMMSTPIDGQHRGDDARQRLLHRLRDVVDVVGHARDQLTALHLVEVRQRQPVDLRLDRLAQAPHRADHDDVDHIALDPAEEATMRRRSRARRRSTMRSASKSTPAPTAKSSIAPIMFARSVWPARVERRRRRPPATCRRGTAPPGRSRRSPRR